MTYDRAANLPTGPDATVPHDPAALRQHPAVVAVYAGNSLAKAKALTGVKASTINRWMNIVRGHYGDVGLPDSYLKRSKALTGRFERKAAKSPGAPRVFPYPIYDRVRAGQWSGSDQVVHDANELGTYTSTVEVRAVDGVEPYALRVDSKSMTDNSGGHTFPPGSLVLVRPGSADLRVGDYVVAFDLTTHETTFKKYGEESGRPRLYPLNPAYPVLDVGATHVISGIVMDASLPIYRRF